MTTQSLLHLAAAQGRHRICRRLLKDGAEFNARDGFDTTPLAALLLTYSLIQKGGIFFRTPQIRAQVEARLAQTFIVLRDFGADYACVNQSIHGPLDAATDTWARTIESRRYSAMMLKDLEQHTARATGTARAQRL
jgi:hypothetical protein